MNELTTTERASNGRKHAARKPQVVDHTRRWYVVQSTPETRPHILYATGKTAIRCGKEGVTLYGPYIDPAKAHAVWQHKDDAIENGKLTAERQKAEKKRMRARRYAERLKSSAVREKVSA